MRENKSPKQWQKNSAEEADKPVDPVKFLGFAIAGMNAFLSRFSQLPNFAAAKIPLTEWLILNSLARNPDLKSINLSRNLGLSVQRIDAILAALKEKNLVVRDEGEAKAWALTENGRTSLADLERGLSSYLAENLSGRERSLPMLVRTLRQLSRKNDTGGKTGEEDAPAAEG